MASPARSVEPSIKQVDRYTDAEQHHESDKERCQQSGAPAKGAMPDVEDERTARRDERERKRERKSHRESRSMTARALK